MLARHNLTADLGEGLWPPYDALSTGQRRRRSVALLGLFAVTGIVIYLLLPDGLDTIVDFELAGDDEVAAYLDNWRPDGLWRVAVAHVVDLAFLVAYGFGLALILDTVARWSAPLHRGWARVLGRGAWLPIAAAAFDVIENLALLVVLTDRTSGWPDLAASAAAIKFALLDVTYVLVVVALVSAGITRLRR